ncbi:hypothetical protein V5799_023653 [Amblyomma americanum]|uniref:Uncharacterized protein n=1 Tax=Amblyomma americanum TaxID=6943 RepID=A0AAQ4FID9_AMBAM
MRVEETITGKATAMEDTQGRTILSKAHHAFSTRRRSRNLVLVWLGEAFDGEPRALQTTKPKPPSAAAASASASCHASLLVVPLHSDQMLIADDCSCSAESSFSWLFLLLLSSLSLTARLERTRTPSPPADETPLGKTTPVKDITAMEEEPQGGMGSSTSRRLLSPRRPSATVSAATEESLEVESGAPHTTCMVWAVKQVAFQKGRATDVSIVSSLSRSVLISVEVTLPEPDPNHTRSTQDAVTTETTTPTTTTEETTTTPTTTKAASVITTTTTTTSATTTPTTTTTPATTTMSTTTRKTTAKTTTTTASGDSKTSITAEPLIGDVSCEESVLIFEIVAETVR